MGGFDAGRTVTVGQGDQYHVQGLIFTPKDQENGIYTVMYRVTDGCASDTGAVPTWTYLFLLWTKHFVHLDPFKNDLFENS